MAQSQTPPRVDIRPEAVRFPSHRQDASLRGQECRPAGDPHTHLPQEGRDHPVPAATHAGGIGRGRSHAVPDRHPCDRIGPILGPQHIVVEHLQALLHRQATAAIRKVRASTAPAATRPSIEFLVMTAARWGAVRWAKWGRPIGMRVCGLSRPCGPRRTGSIGCR